MSPISHLPANVTTAGNSISSASASTMIPLASSVERTNNIRNPLDDGIIPHVPHWLMVFLTMFLVAIILVTMISTARTGSHLPIGAPPPKKARRTRSFKDLKRTWGSSSSSSNCDTLVSTYGWTHPAVKCSKSPVESEHSAPDRDDVLSCLTQANTLKNQHQRRGPCDEKFQVKEQTAMEMPLPPIMRPPGARW